MTPVMKGNRLSPRHNSCLWSLNLSLLVFWCHYFSVNCGKRFAKSVKMVRILTTAVTVVTKSMPLSPIFALQLLVKQPAPNLHTFHKVNIWYLNLNIFLNSTNFVNWKYRRIRRIDKLLLSVDTRRV